MKDHGMSFTNAEMIDRIWAREEIKNIMNRHGYMTAIWIILTATSPSARSAAGWRS